MSAPAVIAPAAEDTTRPETPTALRPTGASQPPATLPKLQGAQETVRVVRLEVFPGSVPVGIGSKREMALLNVEGLLTLFGFRWRGPDGKQRLIPWVRVSHIEIAD